MSRIVDLKVLVGVQLALAALILALTNMELPDRVMLLLQQQRFGTLALTLAVWLLALVSIGCVLTHARLLTRLLWALLMAFSGAVAWGFFTAARIELSVFDLLSFWAARHETGNALVVYGHALFAGLCIAAAGAIVFSAPYVSNFVRFERFSFLRGLMPVLPVALIGGIVFLKGGNGHFAMPKQFSQLSLSGLVAGKLVLDPVKGREDVAWLPNKAGQQQKILLLVDESIRPDYLNFAAGNRDTPAMAAFASHMVNFSPAVSGGVCSSYANAILRFAAARGDIMNGINSTPTLWQYAKKAGYRTVYIDAQASAIKDKTHIQNFMTSEELKTIDSFYPLTQSKLADADFDLLEIIKKELAKDGPVFIYANKHGAHFPYDLGYPATAARFHPTETEEPTKTAQVMINSYRNAVLHSVEGFFARFDAEIDQTKLALVYTSDHGQRFSPGEVTHCTSTNPLPQMALVPLLANAPGEMDVLKTGAKASISKASHFQIAPTLMRWMGYAPGDIATRFDEDLLRGTNKAPQFTLADIFGVFSHEPQWIDLDLGKTYVNADAGEEQISMTKPVGATP